MAAKERNVALDGIRGIAIGAVLFVHLVPGSIDGEKFGRLREALEVTTHGVDLFFVLSGFLIGGILLDNRQSPRALRVFYVRRFLRIVPLYALLLVVTLGFMLRLPEYAAPWWVYATFHGNIRNVIDPETHWLPLAVTWSLAIEEQFYLLAPCMIQFTSRKVFPRLLLGIIAGCYVLRWLVYGFGPAGYAYNIIHFLLPTRADNLATGMLLAWAVRHEEAQPALAWIAKRSGRLLAAASVVVMGYAWWGTNVGRLPAVSIGYLAVNVACGLLVLMAVCRRPGPVVRLLEHPVLTSLGKYAYFLYLWHSLVLFVYYHNLLRRDDNLIHSPIDVLNPIAIALATWLLAVVSWRFLEAPLIRLGHRFSY